MVYLARKDENGRSQTVREHSIGVSTLCAATCAKLGLRYLGMLVGLLHDLGKCTIEFKLVLDLERHSGIKVKHALFGARYAMEELGDMSCEAGIADDSSPRAKAALLAASAIISHHQGLIDLVSPSGIDGLEKAVFQEEERYQRAKSAFLAECASEHELAQLFEQAVEEVENLERTLESATNAALAKEIPSVRSMQRSFSYGMVVRFIASALIDTDRLNVCLWRTGDDAFGASSNADWEACRANVSAHLNNLARKAGSPPELVEARRAVGEACAAFAASTLEPGMFRLTAATGSGKTLGILLAIATFAASSSQPPRVFYLAPYKAILTQNAQEWREAIKGAVDLLEHHSDVVSQSGEADTAPHDDLRDPLVERWSSPIVVSTLVQFLHTLFSPHPRRLRRFQALAGSIIVIDEIQSLPLGFTAIVNGALNFLATVARCTVICMTATQPALECGPLPLALHQSSEMVAPEVGFAPCFDRVHIISRIRPRMSVVKLASFAQERRLCEGSVLVIVNTKPGAHKLYRELVARGEDVILLTQHLCPKHRLDMIGKVRCKLEAERSGTGASFVCVSTSLIEAGVNLSFPCGVRCLIGLDSPAQTAGRVNRHGESLFGNLYIVDYEEERIEFLGDMPLRSACAREILLRRRGDPRLDVAVVEEYYRLLFKRHQKEMEGPIKNLNDEGVALKGKTLLGLFTSNVCDKPSKDARHSLRQALRTAGREAKPIDDDTEAVIVAYDGGETLFEKIRRANFAQLPSLLAQAQPYSVGLTSTEVKRLSPYLRTDGQSGARFLDERLYDEREGVMPFAENLQ